MASAERYVRYVGFVNNMTVLSPLKIQFCHIICQKEVEDTPDSSVITLEGLVR